MAVAFDAQTSRPWSTPTDTDTFTHTGGASATSVALLFAMYGSTTGTTIPSTVTYGGTAMTLENTALYNDGAGNVFRASVYGLADLAGLGKQGSQTVIIDFGAGAGLRGGLAIVSVTGSDTTSCFSASNNATGTATTQSVTVSGTTADEYGVDSLAIFTNFSNTAPVASGATEIVNQVMSGGNIGYGACSRKASSASSTTFTWTDSAANQWAMVGASFKAAGGGGGVTISPMPYYRLIDIQE